MRLSKELRHNSTILSKAALPKDLLDMRCRELTSFCECGSDIGFISGMNKLSDSCLRKIK